MTAQASPTHGSILARLKCETRPEHEAIERVLDLAGVALTGASYRRVLEQFHGFFMPVEGRLQALAGWNEQGIDIAARLRTPLRAADLRALGVATVEALPVCRELPDLTDLAEGFGCLYVLEGSTLGGQYISRHVRTALGVTPEAGGRFFHGYGERTGAMWREFGSALTAFAFARATQDRVVASAVATFRSLRTWCQPVQGR
jgi:heme oxygenase